MRIINPNLRWYEMWMLRFLSKSPRITRIEVFVPEPEPALEDDEPTEIAAQAEFLNRIYQLPPAE